LNSSLPSFLARLLAVVCALPLLCGTAVAQDEQDPLLIHFGFSGRARSNCWTPVLIESALNLTFQGEASIYPSGAGGAERGRFTTAVTLTASGSEGERERFWLYVRPDQGQLRVTAQLEGDRDLRLFEKEPMGSSRFADDTLVFLVACLPSGRPIGLQQELLKKYPLPKDKEHAPYSANYEAMQTNTRRLPNRAIGYDGIDTLLLLNPRMDRDLREDQIEAIMEFVETGGRLVMFVNRYWQQTSRSRLAEILPARFGPLVQLTDTSRLRQLAGRWTPEFKGDLFVPAMQPSGPTARVLVTCGNAPVVLAGTVGMGSVTVVGLDTESAVLQSWPHLPQLAAKLQGLTPRPAPEKGTTGRGFMVGESPERFIIPKSRFGSVAFVWAIILMTLGYIFASGPLLHLVLRGAKRLHWSWPVYMALSLAAAGASFLVVSAFRNRDTVCRVMTVVDFPADGRAAVGRSSYSLRFPDSSLYEVSLDTRKDAPHYVRQGWISLKPIGLGGLGGGLGVLQSGGKLFEYSPTLLSLDRLAVKSNQSRYFMSQWRSEVPTPFFADLRREDGRLRGTLRNTVGRVKFATLFGPQYTCATKGTVGPGDMVDLEDLSKKLTADHLRSLADAVIDKEGGFGSFGAGGAHGDDANVSAKRIFRDVCLSSFYEFYRRSPAKERDSPLADGEVRYLISRNDAARRLDLSHLLDNGHGVLIGVAEIELPDALVVDGREVAADMGDRLVVFRQVVPIK